MKDRFWKINKEKLNKTNIALYSNFIENNYKINLHNDYNLLWKWSVDHNEIFWKSIWDFTKVKGNLGKVFLKKSTYR